MGTFGRSWYDHASSFGCSAAGLVRGWLTMFESCERGVVTVQVYSGVCWKRSGLVELAAVAVGWARRKVG